MVVPPVSELPIKRFVFSYSPIVEPRVEKLRSCLVLGFWALRQAFHQGVCIATDRKLVSKSVP